MVQIGGFRIDILSWVSEKTIIGPCCIWGLRVLYVLPSGLEPSHKIECTRGKRKHTFKDEKLGEVRLSRTLTFGTLRNKYY